MRPRLCFTILLMTLLAIGCRKRHYPPDQVLQNEESVFITATLDNRPIDLVAGADDYYCYTSYDRGPDSVYHFKGHLRRYGCDPCPRSLFVELTDHVKRAAGEHSQPESAFKSGTRDFLPLIGNPHQAIFRARANKTLTSVRWKVDGVADSSLDTIFLKEFSIPGKHVITLNARSTNGCETEISNQIYTDESGTFFACAVEAKSSLTALATFSAKVTGGKAPYTYQWTFGDKSGSTGASPAHQYQYSGSYAVKLVVKDAEQHICEANYLMVAGKDLSSCAANISLTDLGAVDRSLSAVRLQWTDEDGNIFRTDLAEQGNDNFFEIRGSDPFEANEKGEAGRLLSLRFNVLLSDGKRVMRFKSDHAVMAVAYP